MIQSTDHQRHDTSAIQPAIVWIMIAAVAVLLISLAVRLTASWQNYGDLDHNSPGTWVATALDVRDGILYRPIVSSIGYGGSRYAPLSPVIQSVLLRCGLGPVHSGFAIGLCSAVMIVAGLIILMRRLDVPISIAVAMALVTLAATCFRTTILGIKGDLLPAGLNLWGLIAVVWSDKRPNAVQSQRASSLGLLIGTACFMFAFAAKVTSIFGIASAAIYLLFRGRFRSTAILCFGWGVGILIAVLATQWASDGRAIAIFRVCAAGGGGLRALLHGPARMFAEMVQHDRIVLALWASALALLLTAKRWTSLPAILFVITSLGTMAIFGSPGTHLNHLIDLNAAAILVLATQSLKRRIAGSIVMVIVIGLTCSAALACWRQAREIRHDALRNQMNMALNDADTSTTTGPILSEQPLLPILHGERPYMIDSFLFRAMRARRPSIAEKLWQELDSHYFKAVILRGPPTDPDYASDQFDFGPGFIDRLESNYVLKSVHGDFYIFLPKTP